MRQPQSVPLKYDHLFGMVDTGRLKVPMFQRDFVWTTAQTASLLDSIVKGYPIGKLCHPRDGTQIGRLPTGR